MNKYIVFQVIGFMLAVIFLTAFSGYSQSINAPLMVKNSLELVTARKVTQMPNALAESSGICFIASNHIWSLNDAGNTNELFCFDTAGFLLKEVLISNATNIDWEDMTVDNQKRVYIGDAGNNDNDRHDLKIYRIPNPENVQGNVVQAEVINFTLEDQVQFPPPGANRNYDIEAIVWKSDTLFLFTKNRCNPQTGICKMYSLPAQPGSHTAKLRDAIFLGTTDKEARVTSADINLSTGELLLLTETKIVSFAGYPGNRFFAGDMESYYFSNTVGQIEGISFAENGNLFLTEESNNKSGGWLYAVKWKNISSVEETGMTGITMFPNPFHEEITIDWPQADNVWAEVFDVAGKLVYQNQDGEKLLDLQFLDPGVYVVKITSGHQYFVQRMIKL